MNKNFVCGDTHIPIDIKKLNTTKWPEQKKLDKSDVLIQLGDFGGIWYPEENKKSNEDKYWCNWLAKKNFTFCFIDGNHENHDMLNSFPIIEKWGGKVHEIKTKNGFIYHLMRGEVYTINNKKIMTIGGATSQDKESRIEFINWWPNEILSKKEEDYVLNQLDKHPQLDYILTHTCPTYIGDIFFTTVPQGMYQNFSTISKINRFLEKKKDVMANFFNVILEKIHNDEIKVKEWHFGHWHEDIRFEKEIIPFECHYNGKPTELL